MRAPATALATGRLLYGAGLAVAPRLFARVWIGRHARDPRTMIMSRGFGARDFALGAGGLLALHRDDFGAARWWFALQAVTDLADMVGTLEAGRALPTGRRISVAAFAAASAATGLAAAAADVGGAGASGPPAA